MRKEEKKEGNTESALKFGKIRKNMIRARVARLGVLQLNGPEIYSVVNQVESTESIAMRMMMMCVREKIQ